MTKEDMIQLLALWEGVCFGAGWAACGMWLDRCQSKRKCR
jgi:hypothetical protein